MTKAEIVLWSRLKGRQLCGYKFRRQHGIGNYIIDFYCPELSLAVEVDGETHYSRSGVSHDKRRTEYLKKYGILIRRYTNDQVKRNLEGVINDLSSCIKKLTQDA